MLENWPSVPEGSLDASQWEAMRQLLTQRLAMVQGPPGTGKTFVSTIALEILIRNGQQGDPPIIVACQTNHALDQLLAKVAKFAPLYIRLGGRSTSPEVKKRALWEVKKSEVIDNVPGSGYLEAIRDLKAQMLKLKNILALLSLKNSGPMSPSGLQQLGIVSGKQLQSLEKGATQWVRSDSSTDNPMQIWLGNTLTVFDVKYESVAFGFEEIEEDLEFEQLQEHEAEHGVADEEDLEMLQGDWYGLYPGLTMTEPSSSTMKQAKQMLDSLDDLWRAPEYLRGPIYLAMQSKAKELIKAKFREIAHQYMEIAKQLQVGKWERDAVYLGRTNIIGLTTTGLSKYRALIASLKPKIVLIEEASEVLEGAVTVACVESLEHLILVGDHLQLQAHCSVRELEGEPYHLQMSMFERLVRNDMPHKTLSRQRRMDPAFRHLISPIYPELRDHDTVKDRAIVPWGMGETRSFFYSHEFFELQDESLSTFNEYEARMIAKFYRHLIRNGVPAAAITVLTFYNGQRKKILRYLKDDAETASNYNLVKTVDSYQGEENMIVLLSLVRNNDMGKIGFLQIQNRICVSMSRARYGFYMFGNEGFLSQKHEMWNYITTEMHQTGRCGLRLPIECQNHKATVYIQDPEDFDDLDGGCKEICGGRLRCGHGCPLKCHPYPHDRVLCHLRCRKMLVCGHACQKECFEMCICSCKMFEEYQEAVMQPQFHKSSDIQSQEGVIEHSGYLASLSNSVTERSSPEQKMLEFEEDKGAHALESQWHGSGQAARLFTSSPADTRGPQISLLDTSPEFTKAAMLEKESERPLGNGRNLYVQHYQPEIVEDALAKATNKLKLQNGAEANEKAS